MHFKETTLDVYSPFFYLFFNAESAIKALEF